MLFGFLNESQLHQLKMAVCGAMNELGLGKEAVITSVESEVTSCDGLMRDRPFIRICDISEFEAQKIIRKFKQISVIAKYDLEFILVNDFIAKDDNRFCRE
jgi:hypothetical protein